MPTSRSRLPQPENKVGLVCRAARRPLSGARGARSRGPPPIAPDKPQPDFRSCAAVVGVIWGIGVWGLASPWDQGGVLGNTWAWAWACGIDASTPGSG